MGVRGGRRGGRGVQETAGSKDHMWVNVNKENYRGLVRRGVPFEERIRNRAHPRFAMGLGGYYGILRYLGTVAEAVPLEVSRDTGHSAVKSRKETARCFCVTEMMI